MFQVNKIQSNKTNLNYVHNGVDQVNNQLKMINQCNIENQYIGRSLVIDDIRLI